MTTATVIGNGNMGRAITGIFDKGGNSVTVLGHEDGDKPVVGDIVVLAVPYPALADIIEQRREQLAGKVVVDITNPVDFQTFDSLTVAPDSSAAAEIAAALPDSRVVKAFNTTFAATLGDGSVGPATTCVLLAGDDDAAKSMLADAITAGGLKAIDAGSLKRARELEAMGFLQISLAAAGKLPWTAGFAIVD